MELYVRQARLVYPVHPYAYADGREMRPKRPSIALRILNNERRKPQLGRPLSRPRLILGKGSSILLWQMPVWSVTIASCGATGPSLSAAPVVSWVSHVS